MFWTDSKFFFSLLDLYHSWEIPKCWSRKPLPCCFSNVTHLHFPVSYLSVTKFLTGEKNLFFPLSFPLYALISVGNFPCLLQVVELNCEITCSVNQNSSKTLFPICLTCMNTSHLCLQTSYFPLLDTKIMEQFPVPSQLWNFFEIAETVPHLEGKK